MGQVLKNQLVLRKFDLGPISLTLKKEALFAECTPIIKLNLAECHDLINTLWQFERTGSDVFSSE